MTKTIEQLNRELEEARRKFLSGEEMTHTECLQMWVGQEMSAKQFCERDICLTSRWYQYLHLMGREKPGTELDAEDFFLFLSDWINDPTDGKKFWVEDFDMTMIFRRYRK